VQKGCDIIVPVGFMLADATQAAADANPDTHFAIVNQHARACRVW
jgi:basic membrane protein A